MFSRRVAAPGASALRAARIGRPPRGDGEIAQAIAHVLADRGMTEAAERASRHGNRLKVTELVALAGAEAPGILAAALRNCNHELAKAGMDAAMPANMKERTTP